MAATYISGGKARSTDDIGGDINKITDDENFGMFTLNAGASMEGFHNSPDSVITNFGPPFAVVFMSQKSLDDFRDAYTDLSKEVSVHHTLLKYKISSIQGYKLLAIDLSYDGQVVPTLTPVFGARNVKAFTIAENMDTMSAWIQDRICRM
ncbi:unnamed protein product [Cylicostephanus goldi]|uniref:Uncharacterized protein n=1 Tax=Cylicostephanus goldi TaxID=71465 RepID=A0A3P6RVY6_CYLGO|nr:unnamed protein product [Cylicostephanus goldi]